MLLSKKREILLFSGLDDSHFSTWDTTQAGSANDTIELPTEAGGDYSGATIFWGDGKKDAAVHGITHTYDYPGTYQIKIEGKFEGFRFNNSGDKAKLISIDNGGKQFKLGSSHSNFYGCANLTHIKGLNTKGKTNFSNLVRGCAKLIDFGILDTLSCTNMYSMLYGCSLFNGNISNFVTTNVTNMYNMLRNCTQFNQPLHHFNIEAVTSITNMLQGATSWSTANYDAFLLEIANNQNVVDGLSFRCSSAYTGGGAAAAARADLIATDGWTITDLGVA